jgi:hypothetical protein
MDTPQAPPAGDPPDGSDDPIVPRPRPGRQTPPRRASLPLVGVAAGVLRAVAGALAFGASVVALPVHFVTPVLGGVALLMMVGGCLSVQRQARGHRSLRVVTRALVAFCAVIVLVSLAILGLYGPAAFGPDLPGPPPRQSEEPVIRFQAP